METGEFKFPGPNPEARANSLAGLESPSLAVRVWHCHMAVAVHSGCHWQCPSPGHTATGNAVVAVRCSSSPMYTDFFPFAGAPPTTPRPDSKTGPEYLCYKTNLSRKMQPHGQYTVSSPSGLGTHIFFLSHQLSPKVLGRYVLRTADGRPWWQLALAAGRESLTPHLSHAHSKVGGTRRRRGGRKGDGPGLQRTVQHTLALALALSGMRGALAPAPTHLTHAPGFDDCRNWACRSSRCMSCVLCALPARGSRAPCPALVSGLWTPHSGSLAPFPCWA